MKILITGITGYIGSKLASALLREHEVYGLVREPLRTEYIADIQDQLCLIVTTGEYSSIKAALHEVQPDLVYHLAAYCTSAHGSEETPALIASNITFGAYLLETMVECGCTALICASTFWAYYGGEAYRPLNLYAATKQAFSDLLLYYSDAGLLRAVTLVLSDTYGPGDHRPKILNLVKEAAKTGRPLALSDGKQDYAVVYIDDVVQAFIQAGEQLLQEDWTNEVYQVLPDQVFTLRETVERMVRQNGLTLNTAWGARPTSEREIRKAVRLYPSVPGWRAETTLDEGLSKFCSENIK